MDSHDVYVRSLHLQYIVNRLELIIFTIIFILSVIPIPYVWYLMHVEHNLLVAYLVATVPVFIGLSMAVHCRNTIQVLKGITAALNAEMKPQQTFDYDQGRANDGVRMVVTLIAKIIGALLLLWCFSPWPQF